MIDAGVTMPRLLRVGTFLGCAWSFGRIVWCLLAAVVFLSSARLARAGERGTSPSLTVAVAANALTVMQELGRAFEAETGARVDLSSGATGLLAKQLREGAPFDLLVSADMATVRKLADEGLVTRGSVTAYAVGTLVLWQAPMITPRLACIEDLQGAGASRFRIAVANPATAPYGAAAVQALRRSGLWEGVGERVVYGENVGQTLQFAATGNADCAFVPKSLVLAKNDPGVAVPASLHDPIVQGLGVTTRSKLAGAASQLRTFILGSRGQEILRHAGYEPPGAP